MASTAEHFPGHGSTPEDSHLTVPTVSADRALLERRELVPLRAAVEGRVAVAMTAHVVVPALDEVPATLSRRVVTDLLRGELGFAGVVVSDGLDMHAISRTVGHGEGAVRAVDAGVDALCVGGTAPGPRWSSTWSPLSWTPSVPGSWPRRLSSCLAMSGFPRLRSSSSCTRSRRPPWGTRPGGIGRHLARFMPGTVLLESSRARHGRHVGAGSRPPPTRGAGGARDASQSLAARDPAAGPRAPAREPDPGPTGATPPGSSLPVREGYPVSFSVGLRCAPPAPGVLA